MLELLLNNGANVSCEIDEGLTLLHMAIYEGNKNIFYGFIVLKIQWLCLASIGKEEMVKILIENGADVNQVAENGLTALHLAARKGIWKWHHSNLWTKSNEVNKKKLSSIDNVNIVELLIDCGAIVNQVANDGATALHFAALAGNLRWMKYWKILKKLTSFRQRTGDSCIDKKWCEYRFEN